MNTIHQLFQDSARRYADRVFVHHAGRDWTYREVGKRSTSLARWLTRHGLRKGDRVGLLVPNSIEYVISYFGALQADGVVVALNTDTTPRALSNSVVNCEPTAVITAPQCEEHLNAVADQLPALRMVIRLGQDEASGPSIARDVVAFDETLTHPPIDFSSDSADPTDVAQIIYTSGTSGQAKGVVLSHGNLTANYRSIVKYLELTAEDSVLVVLPFCYSYGNSLLLTHVAVGGRLVLAPPYVSWNKTLDVMEQEKVTGFAGVPSTYAALLHRSDFRERSFPELRYVTCAGGALPASKAELLHEAVPHAKVFHMYGQTEASARLSTLMPQDMERKLGSIGKGIPGVKLQVLDEAGRPVAPGEVGEIVAKGDNVMLGYWNDPKASRRVLRPDGLHTGDMARVDEDGFIYIVGRSTEMIKSGAYRIHPEEIEEVILEMEGVIETAVVGRPDEMLGEVAVAHIVTAEADKHPTERDVIEWCRLVLPRHKQIRHALFTDQLPRTSSGKIDRAALRNSVDKTVDAA